ncbi:MULTISPECIES: helix-turn-helix domain-containing protein [Paracoccus]|uniref:Xre family transcriptional regulator n=1 Tax=Paracoccus versutus TaxID=34007 RepID=A0A3D9XNS6_PARVE|nr:MULTISPECIES: helix-turn-helix transcriptional regulator [Paracoccus]REF69822.1 Xre family transcriptional regulator [Paracoccus versutus]WGR57821.1 XRE family transcriptional regulator [Paracoccus versutus]
MGRTLRSPGHLALMVALKQARLDAGLTQTELAERLKRPQSFVAKYENGERRIEVVELVEIATAMGSDPRDIVQIVRDAEGR